MSKNDDKKTQFEKEVFKYFNDKLNGTETSLDKINMGTHTKQEPDILYNNKGIELGAVISGINKSIDEYEVDFIKRINELIKGKIPNTYKIPLIFQKDKEHEIYRALDKFKDYKYITKYLSKLYIEKYDYPIEEQFELAQNNLMQINSMFPNIKKDKELNLFLDEIVDFFKNIDNYKFSVHPFTQNHGVLNLPIWDRKSKDESKIKTAKEGEILKEFFSKKIIEKFHKDKYKGSFDEKILLLHNYSDTKKVMSTNIHFYSHYKAHVFNRVYDLIKEHNSFNIYDEIYFADFSDNFSPENVNIIDFSSYKKTNVDNVILENQRHIRVDFR